MGRGGSAVALDPVTHRLFVGCRSGVIVVLDARTGKELRALPIAAGIDDLIFNPQTKKLYAPCGSGWLIEYQEVNANQDRKVATVASAPGAKNLAFDAASGRLYTVAPPAKGRAGRVLVYQTSGNGA
jgi:hypothetical protein